MHPLVREGYVDAGTAFALSSHFTEGLIMRIKKMLFAGAFAFGIGLGISSTASALPGCQGLPDEECSDCSIDWSCVADCQAATGGAFSCFYACCFY